MSPTRPLRPTRYLMPKLAAALVIGVWLAACGSKTQQQAGAPAAAGPQSTGQTGTTEPIAAPLGPALAVAQASWTPDELQKLVAPIALYPDQLVGPILAASVNTQEVLDAGNWLLQNQNLAGDALNSAAQQAGLGSAMITLVHFPSVVDMMCQEIDWTRQLGAAFTSDQQSVLDAIQYLRAQAQHVGNLESTPQQKVESKVEDNKTVIVIQPADPQVIYVPQYNPQVVYTTPPPPPAPAGTVSTGAAVAGGLIAFGVGALIGSAIASNNCYPHWGAGAVYVGPRPFYPPAYVYRPVYGPAFHPATGYIPPAGYRYAYNNVNVNKNVNINVNNNYFNQFNHNQNLRGATQNNISGATRNPSWKGQSTYAAAKATPAQQARVNEATGRPANTGLPGSPPASAPGSRSRSSPGNPPRSSQTQAGGAGGTRNPALASNRSPSGGLAQNRGPSNDAGTTRSPAVDRGYGTPSRGAPSAPREDAFSGATATGGGGFARAASARGNASASGVGRAGGVHRR